MAELLRLLDITGLRPQVLVGKDIHTDFFSQVCIQPVTRFYTYVCLPGMTQHFQNETFHNFRMGTYNLIIATKWAEDLEIPPASVVIR
jgi:ERCC4-related helicase